MSDPDLDELAAELSEFAAPEAKGGRPPREERGVELAARADIVDPALF